MPSPTSEIHRPLIAGFLVLAAATILSAETPTSVDASTITTKERNVIRALSRSFASGGEKKLRAVLGRLGIPMGEKLLHCLCTAGRWYDAEGKEHGPCVIIGPLGGKNHSQFDGDPAAWASCSRANPPRGFPSLEAAVIQKIRLHKRSRQGPPPGCGGNEALDLAKLDDTFKNKLAEALLAKYGKSLNALARGTATKSWLLGNLTPLVATVTCLEALSAGDYRTAADQFALAGVSALFPLSGDLVHGAVKDTFESFRAVKHQECLFRMDLEYDNFVDRVSSKRPQGEEATDEGIARYQKARKDWIDNYMTQFITGPYTYKAASGKSYGYHQKNLQCYVDEMFPGPDHVQVDQGSRVGIIAQSAAYISAQGNEKIRQALTSMVDAFEKRAHMDAIRDAVALDFDTQDQLFEFRKALCDQYQAACEADPNCRGSR